jgi:hypothetical protein
LSSHTSCASRCGGACIKGIFRSAGRIQSALSSLPSVLAQTQHFLCPWMILRVWFLTTCSYVLEIQSSKAYSGQKLTTTLAPEEWKAKQNRDCDGEYGII